MEVYYNPYHKPGRSSFARYMINNRVFSFIVQLDGSEWNEILPSFWKSKKLTLWMNGMARKDLLILRNFAFCLVDLDFLFKFFSQRTNSGCLLYNYVCFIYSLLPHSF